MPKHRNRDIHENRDVVSSSRTYNESSQMLPQKASESANSTTRNQDREYWCPSSNNTGLIDARANNLTGVSVGYKCDPSHRRIYSSGDGHIYFYGIDGSLLATYYRNSMTFDTTD